MILKIHEIVSGLGLKFDSDKAVVNEIPLSIVILIKKKILKLHSLSGVINVNKRTHSKNKLE